MNSESSIEFNCSKSEEKVSEASIFVFAFLSIELT